VHVTSQPHLYKRNEESAFDMLSQRFLFTKEASDVNDRAHVHALTYRYYIYEEIGGIPNVSGKLKGYIQFYTQKTLKNVQKMFGSDWRIEICYRTSMETIQRIKLGNYRQYGQPPRPYVPRVILTEQGEESWKKTQMLESLREELSRIRKDLYRSLEKLNELK